MSISIGLQLYTLRDETKKDLLGTLEKVANIGYQGVEFAGFGDCTAKEVAKKIKMLNLYPIACHVGIKDITEDIEKTIENCLTLGCKNVVCAYAPFEEKKDYIETAKIFNKAGKYLSGKGIQLCYHNHSHEFKMYDGECGLDILYKECDSELVKAELDTYWVQYAGVDPVEYMLKLKDRCYLIHAKDMSKEDKSNAEVGTGTMDFKGIIDIAKKLGIKWAIVEQEDYKTLPIDCVKTSYENLKKLV